MSVHTRTHRTRIARNRAAQIKKNERSIPWREVAKDNIEKYTEAGLALRGARARETLTQKQLADKLGILPHHVSEMEHGKRSISKKMAHRLAEILNVNYKVFL